MTIGLSKLAGVEHLDDWSTKYVYFQLHTGDPGVNGTANVAVTSTRKSVVWDAPDDSVPGAVSVTHTNEPVWTMAASEDPAYITTWSALTSGDFGGSGQITVDPQLVGALFDLPPGTVVVTQPVAA